jgi:hypothetical protein
MFDMALLRVASASPMAGWQGADGASLKPLHQAMCEALHLAASKLERSIASLAELLDEPPPRYYTRSGKLRYRSVYSADYEWHPCLTRVSDLNIAIAWKVADYLMLDGCTRSLCEV